MKVIYQGITKEHQKAAIESELAAAVPPEKRGEEKKYEIDRDDHETIKERKREARKAWFAQKRADLEKSLAGMDAEREIYGIVFRKGEPVEVPTSSDLVKVDLDPKTGKPTGRKTKLDVLIDSGVLSLAAEKKPRGAGAPAEG